ncbi:hypothetical protein HZR21_10810 [Lactococcus laudensis]|uniref:Opacity-associated protein A-like N-terminal domain-containing protein n=1 Tax=Pseudolactococcus laudensis TaxID=1494461 RepID=A0A7V8SKW2_9LACT|nr:hypothetical protein [Lactococcus laudensis]MBQ6144442.1 hypothetical protein [Lactococcus sp.]MBR2764237.1 hypothetical protein [Lactococcus sp.]MBW9282334.1 hypothetical protein [Lactococcus laudensis]
MNLPLKHQLMISSIILVVLLWLV